MRVSVFLLSFFLALVGWAQAKPKKPANPNRALSAIIEAEQAYIFKQPDFDAEILTILPPGPKVYFISKGKWGPFHKIRLAPGKLGFVLDSDIRIVKSVVMKGGKPVVKLPKKDPRADADRGRDSAKLKPLLRTRYLGPAIQLTNYTEDTMASLRSDTISFIGVKNSGPNGFFDGQAYTDSNLLVFWGAPKYYGEATGNSAEGWVVLADMILQSTQMQSPNILSFFGMGPMFRYSHINAILNEGGVRTEYSLDDMVLGAVFNLGVTARLGQYALRLDGKYYWEKQKYWALGLAFQFDI